MANTKIIKSKIKAITSIKKITKTMEMVSISKMKKSVGEAGKLFEYIKEIKFVIENIKSESRENHIFFDNKKIKIKDELVIIFAANKGLAGSYNSNVYKKTKKIVEENPNIKYAICFGKMAEKTARKLGLEIKLSYLDIEKLLKPSQISHIEKYIRDGYVNEEWNKVHAVYTNFIKIGVFETQTATLYPVDVTKISPSPSLKEGNSAKSIYLFEPSIEMLIEKIVPKIVSMILFSFIIESRASENSARSFAMKRANESAGEILKTLKIKYNKVRQDGITQEIAEISAGANAQ